MPTLYYTHFAAKDITQQLVVSSFLNRPLSTEQIPPKNQSIAFVDNNIILN